MIDIQPNPTYFRMLGFFDDQTSLRKLNELQVKTRQAFLEAMEDGRITLGQREQCLCGGAEFTKIAATDRFGLPFASYLCSNCGLIVTNPFIAEDSLPKFYNEFYHALVFGRAPDPDNPLYQSGQGGKIFHILHNHLPSKIFNVLEVGAGLGTVMKEFIAVAVEAGFEAKITGLEYSSEYVEKFEPEGYDLVMLQGGLDEVLKTGTTYDVVIMSHVFEHFAYPSKELDKLKRIIGPSTLLFIEVPGVFSLKYRYAYNCDFIDYLVSAHMFNFNLASLTHILNQNGFKLIWGNETVEAIFILGEQVVDVSENADMIKTYLLDCEVSRTLYSSLNPQKLRGNLGIKKIEDRTKKIEKQMGKAMEVVYWYNNLRSLLPYRVLSWIYKMTSNFNRRSKK